MESRNVGVMALKSLIDDPESLCQDHFGTKYTTQNSQMQTHAVQKRYRKWYVTLIERNHSVDVWRKPPILLRLLLEGVAGRKYGTVHYILEANTYVVFRILLDSWHIMGMEPSHVPL